ncbi:uncharacterized protein LOC9658347 [Selaginella moellendorffii]|uniref:uncharacterized protein LOC9658347 n=1 Tax=Selaginella moellendorffii TaxID=88036 RepID=UPI000D1C9CA4|nr:uncharacterized protein LOC9658347 [Selaginella moellendorffii]|eukprot:XP_024541804.1 uncharacterized protein LOC9658347 [Selaginella moellendorffii]
MGRPSVFVVIFIIVAHIISFAMSLGAETRRTKYYYCKYKLDIASGLAGAAFVFNLLSFLLIMGMTKIVFIIAEACLLAGVNRNQMRTKTIYFQGQNVPDCETISKGIFSAAAAFTFFCLILSLSYYVSAAKSEDSYPLPPRPPSVGMTMFPQQPSGPSPYAL